MKPSFDDAIVLQTDASCTGIGAILPQEDELTKHSVAFASKKLLPMEQNYSTIEREALAMVWGFSKVSEVSVRTAFLPGDRSPPSTVCDQG